MTYDEELFLSQLGVGIERAKTVKELSYSSREVRLIVSGLREKGYPICSGTTGYWIAKNKIELDSTIVQLRSRVAGIDKAIEGLLGANI